MPGANDQVINLPSGKPVWQAGGPDAHIQRFAGDGRFLVVGDRRGVRLETLGGGDGLLIENSRRTDYDASARNDLSRYTPIVAAGVAAQNPREIVTALKDGRITVWDATLRLRLGVMGIPLPDFQSLARFDHGEELGAQLGWVQLPALFVSPSGRYVASESPGLRTNSAGGIMGADPLVRIWDRYRRSEIARFRPGSPMIVVAFAPADDRVATVESRSEGDDKSAPSIRFALWDIRAPQPDIETTRRTGSLPLTPPANPPGPPNNPLLRQPFTGRAAAALWLGFDLKVRAMNPETGTIMTIDDVKDAFFKSAVTKQGRPSEEVERLLQVLAGLSGTPAPSPEAPFKLLPLAVSGDGRRAVLVAGASARLYALDGPPRLLRTVDLAPWVIPGAGFMGALNAAMSRDGDAFAITTLGTKSTDKESPQRMEDMEATHLIFAPDAAAPTKILHGELMPPMPIGAISRDQIVALGPNARTAAIDQTLRERSGWLRRAVVRDLTSGRDILTFPDREMTIGPGGVLDADGSSGVVAGFDATGLHLAMARDPPNCPMMVTTMTWVPSCPERRIEIETWDLEKRKKIGETGFVMTPESGAKWSPVASSIGLGLAQTVPLGVDLPDPSAVGVTAATFHSVETEGGRTLKVDLTRRRVALNGDGVRTAACERLPRAFAEPDLPAWTALVPNEGFRPICRAPAAAQRP